MKIIGAANIDFLKRKDSTTSTTAPAPPSNSPPADGGEDEEDITRWELREDLDYELREGGGLEERQ